jgi:hypothetical protein
MKNVMKTNFGIVALVAFLCILMGAATNTTRGQDRPLHPPVIEKMSSYKGDSFSRFAEFRVQKYENKLSQNAGAGVMVLRGEPYDVLINVSDINLVYRLSDRSGKMYSCMMHVNFQDLPILVRQDYKEVMKSIRKAAEMMVK